MYKVNQTLVNGQSSITLLSQEYVIYIRVNTHNGTTMYSPQARWNNNLVSVYGPYAVGASPTEREYRVTVNNYYNGSYQGGGYLSFTVDDVSTGINITH
ncbi:MAG: hypothetical protein LBO67_04440 [Spirochaetaceae bacterium]|nr:hypothetical protein [Spirochaetaceae bacterium]